MRSLGYLVSALALAPTAWAHPVAPECPCPSPVRRCDPPPNTTPSERVGILEVAFGLTTRYVGVLGEGDTLQAQEQDSAPLLSLTPGLEWQFGRILYVGADVTFLSVEDPTSASGRRSVTAPGLRARMSFGVVDRLVADAVFGAGVALWSGEGGPSLIGWSRRMSFGGAYEVTDDLWAFAHLGSLLVQAGPAGKGPLSSEFDQAQPVGSAGFTLTLGVRSLL
jgi:hypothetical protein